VTNRPESVTLSRMSNIDRRAFLAGGLALPGLAMAANGMGRSGYPRSVPLVSGAPGDDHRGRCSIASGNGIPAVTRAMEMIAEGVDPVDAVVEGVTIVENDPDDMSVGYGGLPNEDGVVQLDASVMHGPTHKAGAVACIENIKNPAKVALQVLKRTDHVLIVGEGAKRFALRHGFTEENLLTERAREAWLRWKRNLNPSDDWLDDNQLDFDASQGRRGEMDEQPLEFTYGTINCSGVTDDGMLAGVTTTSGLSWKIPGRVGDSPIVGAGMFVDNAVGAAGATGRGEAVIQNCGAFSIVREMESGKTPTEACLAVLKRIADNTRQKRLLNDRGEPNFGVTCYALRKDGAYGSATMRGRGRFAVHDGDGAKLVECARLYE